MFCDWHQQHTKPLSFSPWKTSFFLSFWSSSVASCINIHLSLFFSSSSFESQAKRISLPRKERERPPLEANHSSSGISLCQRIERELETPLRADGGTQRSTAHTPYSSLVGTQHKKVTSRYIGAQQDTHISLLFPPSTIYPSTSCVLPSPFPNDIFFFFFFFVFFLILNEFDFHQPIAMKLACGISPATTTKCKWADSAAPRIGWNELVWHTQHTTTDKWWYEINVDDGASSPVMARPGKLGKSDAAIYIHLFLWYPPSFPSSLLCAAFLSSFFFLSSF